MTSCNILFHFPNSHYCEKSRWLLDYKKIAYQRKDLLPGPHIKTIKQYARRSSMPLLLLNDEVIHTSDKIADFIEKKQPTINFDTFPKDPNKYQTMLELEQRADKDIGLSIRCILYDQVVEDRNLITKLFVPKKQFFKRLYIRVMHPKLVKIMRRSMKINSKTAKQAEQTLATSLKFFAQILKEQPYLLGEQFSRADMTLAALLAPLHPPASYGENFPKDTSAKLEELRGKHKFMLQWMHNIYKNHR